MILSETFFTTRKWAEGAAMLAASISSFSAFRFDARAGRALSACFSTRSGIRSDDQLRHSFDTTLFIGDTTPLARLSGRPVWGKPTTRPVCLPGAERECRATGKFSRPGPSAAQDEPTIRERICTLVTTLRWLSPLWAFRANDYR